MNIRIFNKFRLLLLSIAVLGLGCSKEHAPNDAQSGDQVEVSLSINAPAAAAALNNETNINRLRVVVFSSIGTSDAGRLILNKYYATVPTDKRFKEIITSGKRDILIIVNEPLTGDGRELDSYKNIATMSDVRNLSLIYGGAGSIAVYTPAEIPMFISHINKQVLVNGANEISGDVERVMAKVTMKLNVKSSNFPVGKHVVIDNMTIKNLPQSSSLIAKLYADDVLVSSEKQNAGVALPISGYDFSYINTFYVPEYIFSNPDKGAYIEIVGHINGEPTRVTKWTVKLGDAMDDAMAYGDRYNITRNRHYTFTGDVKSYGEMNDLAVKVTVLPWNTVNLDEDVGHYVAFNKVTNTSGAVIADGDNLNDLGETITVTCNTNTGGWYTVTRNAAGAIVHTSTPTAAVTVAADQTLNVVIPKLVGFGSQTYTIGVYHPTIALESLGPVKEIKFVQRGGFIPNSVLAAAGWPEDKLPIEGGLQLALRGNVLPGGTALPDDPMMQWKSREEPTLGVEFCYLGEQARSALGSGKKSADAMTLPSQIDLHPAAKHCRSMGPEWYVPSLAEWKLITANRSTFGSHYQFSPNTYYWSATESEPKCCYLWCATDNYQSYHNKLTSQKVRCVKGTPPPTTDGSYIPRAVLQAAGWPVDKLPAIGLQLAMRGNILPGGTAADKDMQLKWKVNVSIMNTPGVEAVDYATHARLGMGKSNTDAMIADDVKYGAQNHPAAQYCRSMGPEWYLPSLAELHLIVASWMKLPYPYAIAVGVLMSSTQVTNSLLHYNAVFQYTGGSQHSSKSILSTTRCVREI